MLPSTTHQTFVLQPYSSNSVSWSSWYAWHISVQLPFIFGGYNCPKEKLLRLIFCNLALLLCVSGSLLLKKTMKNEMIRNLWKISSGYCLEEQLQFMWCSKDSPGACISHCIWTPSNYSRAWSLNGYCLPPPYMLEQTFMPSIYWSSSSFLLRYTICLSSAIPLQLLTPWLQQLITNCLLKNK